jgi:hypothetical protein
MNITITLHDNTTLNPSFDPVHKENLITFYNNQVSQYQIRNYVARNNAGKVVALGGRF